jgi:hypothetical protein
MKKTFFPGFLTLVLLATACATASAGGKQDQNTAQQVAAPVVMSTPAWMNESAPSDVFIGIGGARMQRQERSLPVATARARRDVAEQLSILVQGMLIDYFDQGGNINNEDANDFTMSVGRELVNAELVGAEPINRTQMPDGYWWVRVALPKDEAKRTVANIVNRQASRYSQIRAEDALREMDARIDRTQSRPTPRTED